MRPDAVPDPLTPFLTLGLRPAHQRYNGCPESKAMPTPDEPLIRVQARIEDAGLLADHGRLEGALLMLLVAVAATSRKRYPRGTPSKKKPSEQMRDGEAFRTFLRDEIWRLVKEHSDLVKFEGEERPIEDFLYEFLRCQ